MKNFGVWQKNQGSIFDFNLLPLQNCFITCSNHFSPFIPVLMNWFYLFQFMTNFHILSRDSWNKVNLRTAEIEGEQIWVRYARGRVRGGYFSLTLRRKWSIWSYSLQSVDFYWRVCQFMTGFTVFKSDSHDHTRFIVNILDHIKYSVLQNLLKNALILCQQV